MDLAQLGLAFLTAVFFIAALLFLYLYTLLRRQYFLLWTAGWVALLARALSRVITEREYANSLDMDLAEVIRQSSHLAATWWEVIGSTFLLGGTAVAIAGLYRFVRREVPLRTIVAIGTVAVVATLAVPLTGQPIFVVAMVPAVAMAFMSAWIAALLFGRWRARRTLALFILGALFALLCVYKIAQPLFLYFPHLAMWRTAFMIPGLLIESTMAVLVSGLMIVVALDEIREELGESELRFRQFFEGASDPIFLVEPEGGHILDANPRGCGLLGYSREELLRMTVLDLASPDEGTSPAGLLSKIRGRGNGGPETVQTHHRHRDGRLIPISVTRSVIDLGGRQLLLLHTRDISELRGQERQLASRITQLQAIQRVSTVLSRTLRTDEVCHLLYENTQMLFLLDYFGMDWLDERSGRLENLSTMHMVNGVMSRVPGGKPGSGLPDAELRRMMEQRQARLVQRAEIEPKHADRYPECCRSLVVVPMVAGDESVGLLAAGSNAANGFDGSQIDILQHIASIAGIALRNAQLYEMQQAQVSRQKFLAELGPQLLINLDYLHAASIVAANLKSFLDLSDIEVWLVSDDLSEGVLYRAYPSGRPASIPVGQNKSTPANYDIVIAAFSSGLTIVENDCRDSRLIPEAWVTEAHLKSCMAAPIMVGDRAIGIIRLDDTRRFGRFRPDDTEFIKLVAQIMATALEAARLFAQVKSSEQRFSQLVEASSVGIAIVRDRFLEFANSAFMEMLELSDTPISSLSVYELIPADQESTWRRAFEAVEEGKGDQRLEGWMQRPDGNRIWCEVFLSSIGFGGLRAIQMMVDDITEKKAAQAQRQNDLRVRSIGTLTAGIGQDFQALFSVILGHTAYLKLKGIDSDAATRSILAVEAAVMRALDFTRQLLTFAETSEGGMAALELNSLIVQAARLHEGIVPERPRMKFDLAASLPKVRGNEEQLRQALLNLLLAFSERAGEGNLVVMQSVEEMVDEEWARENKDLEPGSYVSVLFSDRRGVVDPEAAEALLSTSSTTMGRGTLGMSVLLSTVKTHQGAIEVRRGGTSTLIALMLPVDSGMPASPGARLLSGTTPGAASGTASNG